MKKLLTVIAFCVSASYALAQGIGGLAGLGGKAGIGGGASGVCQLTPPSGLQAWYRADAVACTGGCNGGNPVTSWTDQSANANTLTASTAGLFKSNQINNRPAVRFNGSTTRYTFGTALNLQTASTMFAVLKLNATGTQNALVSGNDGSLLWGFADAAKEQVAEEVNHAVLGNSTSAQDTNYHQMNMSYDNTTVTFRLGSAADGSAAPAATIIANDTEVGRNVNLNARYFNGDLAELLIFNVSLSLPNKQLVETYLQCRYGI